MKRKNKILTSILIMLFFNSCQNPKQDKITESDVYNFINEVIPTLAEGHTNCDVIVDKPILNVSGKEVTTEEELLILKKAIKGFYKNKWIKRQDIDYLLSQQNDSTFIFKQDQIHKKLISNQTIDSIFNLPDSHGYYTLHKELNVASFGRISKPFFTRDKNTAIIVFDIYRNYENANGSIFIFKKDDDKWVLQKWIETWIS
jgi:hypothetical protein